MIFNSIEFLLFFLPVALAGFVFAARTAAMRINWLICCSIFFYGWHDWRLVGLLAASVGLNFLAGTVLAATRRRSVMVIAVALNLGLLGLFKYAGLFVGTLNALTGTGLSMEAIVLPLAISFFTFQQIAYIVDIWTGVAPARKFTHYVLFVVFFPHLIAGPLLHHGEMLTQFSNDDTWRPRFQSVCIGLNILVMGLVKKVLLGDSLKPIADSVFQVAETGQTIGFVPAWIGIAAFTLQIYFDFSGYSDMAVGLARMFGVRLPANFDSPYKASNIIDFWRRWHITLSRFLRDYLYVPLGGNRLGGTRRYVNLMTVMLLGGLWHGANWTFAAWGALHGLYLCINWGWRAVRRHLGADGKATPAGRICSQALTLTAVAVAWVFFRAPDFATAGAFLKGMAGLNGIVLPAALQGLMGNLSPGLSFDSQFVPGYPARLDMLMVAAFGTLALIAPNTQQLMRGFSPVLHLEENRLNSVPGNLAWRPGLMVGLAAGLVGGASLILAYIKPNAFIYFQF
jgi:alginate O-acetyltransferase complex protein AlgI